MGKELQIVGFQVGRETYGVPIGAVQEILRTLPITAVPGAPPQVEGVINLRGRIVSVVDLRKRCGVRGQAAGPAGRVEDPPPHEARKNRIVVAEVLGRRVGMLVDSASEVLRIAESCIEPPSTLFGDTAESYVTGVAKLPGRLVILVDISKMLQGAEAVA